MRKIVHRTDLIFHAGRHAASNIPETILGEASYRQPEHDRFDDARQAAGRKRVVPDVPEFAASPTDRSAVRAAAPGSAATFALNCIYA